MIPMPKGLEWIDLPPEQDALGAFEKVRQQMPDVVKYLTAAQLATKLGEMEVAKGMPVLIVKDDGECLAVVEATCPGDHALLTVAPYESWDESRG